MKLKQFQAKDQCNSKARKYTYDHLLTDLGDKDQGNGNLVDHFHLGFQSQITDFRRRAQFQHYELKSRIAKLCIRVPTVILNKDLRDKLLRKFHIQKASKVRIKNRCVLSGRASTMKHYRLSRIYFRTLANLGQLPGVSKNIHL